MTLDVYLTTFLVALAINLFFFLFAYSFKTDKLTDFTYGLTFIILAVYLTFSRAEIAGGHWFLLMMVLTWALRLIGYLLARIWKIKKDSRFDTMRENFWGFLKFWFFQGVAVWVILLPAIYYLTSPMTYALSGLSFLGMAIWLVGLLIETIADKQKFDFKNSPKQKTDWIQSGLWKYSRHPNYFGEMMLWWGVFIFVSPTLMGWSWLTISGPLFIMFILRFVSGIPLLEKKYEQKYRANADYQKYKLKTSLLIPLPPKR